MADNIELSSGTGGATVATDDIGGVHYQINKVAHGALETATLVTSSAGLPVTPDSGGFEVNLSATDNAVLDNIQTSVDTVAAAVSTEMQVDIVGITPDLMLGTDFSSVLGTTSLILATQADAVANTSDGLQTTDFNMVFNGTTWDRVREGSEAGSILVDLGANNDVTVTSGVITETNSTAILADTANMDTNLGTIAGAVAAGQMQVDIVADGAGLLTTAAHDAAFGTAGTADAQVRTVQGIAGGTAVPVSGTLTANPASGTIDTVTNLAQMGGVAITRGNGASGTGVQRVTLADDSTGQVKLAAGTAGIGKLTANSGVDIGDVDVTSIAAGANLIGDVAIQGRTTGGLTTFYDEDLDETKVAVKASAATLYAIEAFNTTAAPLFLQLFNVASGSVTVGTTKPTNQWVIPGNADSDGSGFTFNVPQGIAYGTAITAACTTNSEGSAAPGAGACIVNIHYK